MPTTKSDRGFYVRPTVDTTVLRKLDTHIELRSTTVESFSDINVACMVKTAAPVFDKVCQKYIAASEIYLENTQFIFIFSGFIRTTISHHF